MNKKSENLRLLRQRNRQVVNDIKLQRGCENPDCQWEGEFHPHMLHFHHLVPSTKEQTVAYLIKHSSLLTARKEIDKCEVLCANCHALHHVDC